MLEFFHLAQSVAPVVSGAVAQASTEARPFGLTIIEWSILLPALAAFVKVVLNVWRSEKKVQVLVEGLEEMGQLHPEAGKIGKRLVRDKATKMGVEVSSLWAKGLESDVKKMTQKFKKVDRDAKS